MAARRRELTQRIARAAKRKPVAWTLQRRGGNHDVYKLGDLVIPIPRHAEIIERTAERILRECEPELGVGWWRND